MRDALLAFVFPISMVIFAMLGTAASLQDSDPWRRPWVQTSIALVFVTWTAVLLSLLAISVRLSRIHRECWSADDTYSLLSWVALTVPIFLPFSLYVLSFMHTGFPPSDPAVYLRNAAMPIVFGLAVWVSLTLIKREALRERPDVTRTFRVGLADLLRRLEARGEPRLRLEKEGRNPLDGRVNRAELASVLGKVVLVGASRRVTTARVTGEDWRPLADLVDSAGLGEAVTPPPFLRLHGRRGDGSRPTRPATAA